MFEIESYGPLTDTLEYINALSDERRRLLATAHSDSPNGVLALRRLHQIDADLARLWHLRRLELRTVTLPRMRAEPQPEPVPEPAELAGNKPAA